MDTKKVWQSKTVWGAAITLLSTIALLFGAKVTGEEQIAITESTMGIVGGIGELFGFVLVIIGRFKAVKRIG